MIFIEILRNLFSAAFYIVPPLVCLAWLGRDTLRRRPGAGFLITAMVFFLAWRMAANLASGLDFGGRYYLPVAMLMIAVAPSGIAGGVELAGKFIRHLRGGRLQLRLAVLFTLLICAAQTVRVFTVSDKRFLYDFALKLHKYNRPETLLIDATGEGTRLKLLNNSDIDLYQVPRSHEMYYFWEDLFRRVESASLTHREFLLLAREEPAAGPEGGFENIMRENMVIFPFDLMASAEYRHYRYLLYRFNHKTGDGVNRPPLSRSAEPASISIPYANRDFKFKLNDYSPDRIIDGYTAPWGNGSVCNAEFLYNPVRELVNTELKNGSAGFALKLATRNLLLWPLAQSEIPVIVSENMAAASAPARNGEPPAWRPESSDSDFVLQLNLPGVIYLPPGGAEIYGENFLALPHAGGRTVELDDGTGHSEGSLTPATESSRLKITARDAGLKISGNAVAEIVRTAIPAVPLKLRILFLESGSGSGNGAAGDAVVLKDILAEYNVEAEITAVQAADGEGQLAFASAPERLAALLPDGRFDAVLADLGQTDINEFARFYLLYPERRKLDPNVKGALNLLSERYPEAEIGIALPQCPFSGEVRYDIGTSVRWNRKKLAHMALARLLSRAVAGQASGRFSLAPLQPFIHPEKGYQLMSDNPPTAFEPMLLSENGLRQKYRAAAAWLIARSGQHEKKEANHE